MDTKNLDGLKAAVALTRWYMDDQEKSMYTLRDIAKTFFGAGSVLVSIISVLNIFVGSVAPGSVGLYNALILLLAAVYVGFVVVNLFAIRPTYWHKPFPENYDILIESLCVEAEEREAMLLSAHLKTLELNKPLIEAKNKLVLFSGGMLGALVLILLILAFIPKVV